MRRKLAAAAMIMMLVPADLYGQEVPGDMDPIVYEEPSTYEEEVLQDHGSVTEKDADDVIVIDAPTQESEDAVYTGDDLPDEDLLGSGAPDLSGSDEDLTGLIEDPELEAFGTAGASSFEEEGVVLLDDPTIVTSQSSVDEADITTDCDPECVLRASDIARAVSSGASYMRHGQSFSGEYGNQLEDDSKDFYDGLVSWYQVSGNSGNYTREYSKEESPLSFDARCELKDGVWSVKKTDDSGSKTQEFQDFCNRIILMAQSAVDAFCYDYPDVFWIRPYQFKYWYSVDIDPDTIDGESAQGRAYLTSVEYVTIEAFGGAYEMRSDYESGKSRILAEIEKSADIVADGTITPAEYVLADHDYICDLISYDQDAYDSLSETMDYSICTAAKSYLSTSDHRAVCECYAKTLKSLLDIQGVPSCIMADDSHMWNAVCIGDYWYLVDCTWDDEYDIIPSSREYLLTRDKDHYPNGNFSGSTRTTVFVYPALSDSDCHIYQKKVTPATCTEPERTLYTCILCSDSYEEESALALGHDYSELIDQEAASCTGDGYEIRKCSRCEETQKSKIPATGHDYKATVIEPTCSSEGYTKWTCSRCGDSYISDTTSMLGHDFVLDEKSSKDASCIQDGCNIYRCKRCGETKEEVIRATGHQYETKTVETGCESGGYTIHICKTCGAQYRSDQTKPLGHDYVMTKKTDATCTEDGEIIYTCSRCHKTKTESIPKTGHSYQTEVVQPTRSSQGYTLHSCTKCGSSYKSDYVPVIKNEETEETKSDPSSPVADNSSSDGNKADSESTLAKEKEAGQSGDPSYTTPAQGTSSAFRGYEPADTGKTLLLSVETLSQKILKSGLTKKPVLKKAKRYKKNKVKVTWKKNKKMIRKASGIQIQVATDRQFTKNVHYYKVGKKKTSRVINLKRKTTWYVRILYYNKQGYSAWSNIRKVSK